MTSVASAGVIKKLPFPPHATAWILQLMTGQARKDQQRGRQQRSLGHLLSAIYLFKGEDKVSITLMAGRSLCD
jgi:hypothetical protein